MKHYIEFSTSIGVVQACRWGLQKSLGSRIVSEVLQKMILGSTKYTYPLRETTRPGGTNALGVVLVGPQRMIAVPRKMMLLEWQENSGKLVWASVSEGGCETTQRRTCSTRHEVQMKQFFLPVFDPFRKVDDEFIELFVVESVVVTHPMGGVTQREMQLGQSVSN